MEMRISIILNVRSRALVGLVVAAVVGSSACGAPPAAARADVVTTTPLIRSLVERIVGQRLSVRSLTAPAADPHELELTPRNLVLLGRARLVVRNGAGLEQWFDSGWHAASPRGRLVDASVGVQLRSLEGETDPHIWQNPRNVTAMATTIAAGLRAVDPDGAAVYDTNLAALAQELDALDSELDATYHGLVSRKLVTNHDAFGYLADRFGLTVVGSVLPSFNTQAELSASDVQRLVGKIRSEGVRVVFSDARVPAKAARALADEAGVAVVAGDGSLYGDGLGPAGSDAADYVSMMRHNARVIVEGLR